MSYREDARNLQLEINHLHRKMCHKEMKGTPSSSGSQFDDDASYRTRSKTPYSKSFSYNEERHHR